MTCLFLFEILSCPLGTYVLLKTNFRGFLRFKQTIRLTKVVDNEEKAVIR